MLRQLQGVILLAVVLGLAAWLPRSGISQVQDIVFSEVNVSGDEASLSVELENGDLITGSISNGEIRLNGDVVGEYSRGDDFDASWRALLGRAVMADPGELADLLGEWTLPEGMTTSTLEGAEALRSALQDAVETQIAADPPLLGTSPQARSALQGLFQRSDRLRDLAQVVDDLDPEGLTVYLGESVRVEENETREGSLLIVDGDLTVDGTVEGDVILLGGSLALGPNGRVEGTARTADAEIRGDRGRIEDGIVEIVTEIDRVLETREIEETTRDAVREARAEARQSARDLSFWPGRSPLRWIGQGLAGLLQTLVTFAILFGAGLAVLYFFPRHLEVVSRTVKGAPGRSLLVGLAGLVLAVPLFVVGIVLLAVSIIGIPLLLVWIPILPLALASSIAFGYLAVARNLGGWFSSRDLPGFEGLDRTRPAVQIGTGLAILLASLALCHVFHMGGPIFGIFSGFLMFVFVVGTIAATTVGLGAVILTRAGRDPRAAERWQTAERDPRAQGAPSNA